LADAVASSVDADRSSTAAVGAAAAPATGDSSAAATVAVDAQTVSNSGAVSSDAAGDTAIVDTTATTATDTTAIAAAAGGTTASTDAASDIAVSAINSAVASHQADVASDMAGDVPMAAPTAPFTVTGTDTAVASATPDTDAQPAAAVVDSADISSSGDSSTTGTPAAAVVDVNAGTTNTSGAETDAQGDSDAPSETVTDVTAEAVTDNSDATQQQLAVEASVTGLTSLTDAAAAATETTATTASSESSDVTAAAHIADVLTDTADNTTTSISTARTILFEGTAVEARYKGRERYYTGTIARVNSDGTYDINYSDDERELSVAAEYIRTVTAVGTTNNRGTAIVALQEGAAVAARYKGRERYFAGVIRRVNSDGTYDIAYDDGEIELSVTAELIRLVNSSKNNNTADTVVGSDNSGLQVGAAIEARYEGRARYYAATVARVNSDGTYDINYSDGERELGVAAEYVKLVQAAVTPAAVVAADTTSSDVPIVALQEGAVIEARYKGRESYYAATVARVNSDGTYDINYNDGERELGVLAEYVRPIAAAVTAVAAAAVPTTVNSDTLDATTMLQEGAAVEARYKGRERYFPGLVRRVNRDGTYDINYSDGERELGVLAEYIKAVAAPAVALSSSAANDVLHEGTAVEARYKRRERYYTGSIARVNSDGTYDINYSDGERELSIAAEYIRTVAAAVDTTDNSDTAAVALQEGVAIEARYKGRERYYGGTVAHVNSDGTYDINYNDGERELSVAAEYVRLVDAAVTPTAIAADTTSSDVPIVVLPEGTAVEARYKGRERYFQGLVRRVNRDGTYDIDYSDGERELGVLAEYVKPLAAVAAPAAQTAAATVVDSSSSEVSGVALSEGATVEARYKGRARYFPGTIAHVNSDGTYDINYDDGTPELGVSPELVKAVGTTTAAAAVNSSSSATDSVSEQQQQQQAVASGSQPDTTAAHAATADEIASDAAVAAAAATTASDQHSAASPVIAGGETVVKGVDEDDYFAAVTSGNGQPLNQLLDTAPLQVHTAQLLSSI
jgi:hypothetical protein